MGQNRNETGSASRARRRRVERGKRSRNGCATCISKKVKCDETRPNCTRCVRLQLACEWALPKPSLASRRRGFGPIKDRNSGLWSPSAIMPKKDDRSIAPDQSNLSTLDTQDYLPSPGLDELLQSSDLLAELEASGGDAGWWQDPTTDRYPAETSSSMTRMPNNGGDPVDLSGEIEPLRVPLIHPLFNATELSFTYASGFTPALGNDDEQAVLFHCKIFASLKSTRSWTCSAHTLFLDKAYRRDMALHFLLAVSHSELAIYYGQGPEPPHKSREHFDRGSQLFLQAHNLVASPDHVGMLLSFLYMYMFRMRRDRLDPIRLRDLSRAVFVYIRTYGLDTLCARDDVLSYDETGGMITVSEQVLLARVIIYLYDRDGFCCFFGCGGDFANHLNRESQTLRMIWMRSRATFLLSSSNFRFPSGTGTEIDDAPTLDVYFELIVLHQEINVYSRISESQSTAMKLQLQKRLDTIHKDHAPLFSQVVNSSCHGQGPLMAYVTVTFFYALQIYLHRARWSSFGTRPVPTALQEALSSLIAAAYHAIRTGPVQLLERFQWSLFMSGLETTDPVHQEWIGKNLSDPAMKEGFDHLQAIKQQSPRDITMQKIRSLVDQGLSVSHARQHPG
ncbi:hypothetical protein BJX61DRAFT_531697 [Aspergillus egyptiacus]|nr:hypothetical protein BJX61DRAFT_531697 [Aspergillus egyptiacus]